MSAAVTQTIALAITTIWILACIRRGYSRRQSRSWTKARFEGRQGKGGEVRPAASGYDSLRASTSVQGRGVFAASMFAKCAVTYFLIPRVDQWFR